MAGSGNWWIAHDRIGPLVLERLEAMDFGKGLELCHLGTTGLDIIDCLRGQKHFILVDAACGRDPPGTIQLVPMASVCPVSRGVSLHQIGPLEGFALAAQLFPESLPKRASLITVETLGLQENCFGSVTDQVVNMILKETGLQAPDFSDSGSENLFSGRG